MLIKNLIFQCNIEVTDNGYPTEKTDTAQVNIIIRRGELPTWVPDSTYYATVNENDPNGTFIVDVEATKANPLVRNARKGHHVNCNKHIHNSTLYREMFGL